MIFVGAIVATAGVVGFCMVLSWFANGGSAKPNALVMEAARLLKDDPNAWVSTAGYLSHPCGLRVGYETYFFRTVYADGSLVWWSRPELSSANTKAINKAVDEWRAARERAIVELVLMRAKSK